MRVFRCVVTTIQAPTDAIHEFVQCLSSDSGRLIIVGDQKGPKNYPLPGVQLLSLDDQRAGPFELARQLPTGHYTRKNIGYLQAILDGAECLYETDDDNAPLPDWAPRAVTVPARAVKASGWINAYRCFSRARIWPRGFPLDALSASFRGEVPLADEIRTVRAPIQQGLANGAPDVDAVWRLVLDAPFEFEQGPSIRLPPGAWCPFNSQSTWWWPEAYPLLYLPSHCSFRMTDIWRSFVAQRCLWAMDAGVVFHAPEVHQERNAHDLMRDFRDEVPGYLENRRMVEILESLSLAPAPERMGDNLLHCYEALVASGHFPPAELTLVRTWLSDLANVQD